MHSASGNTLDHWQSQVSKKSWKWSRSKTGDAPVDEKNHGAAAMRTFNLFQCFNSWNGWFFFAYSCFSWWFFLKPHLVFINNLGIPRIASGDVWACSSQNHPQNLMVTMICQLTVAINQGSFHWCHAEGAAQWLRGDSAGIVWIVDGDRLDQWRLMDHQVTFFQPSWCTLKCRFFAVEVGFGSRQHWDSPMQQSSHSFWQIWNYSTWCYRKKPYAVP